jgi:BirA family transcriptional regulator, biotin operon repressor / biotin---[acetyl-CoA-carboxylase] ligase
MQRPRPCRGRADGRMTGVIDSEVTGWLSRFEQFDVVGSTNDIVAGWLAEGTPEVCVAIADVQTAGRGRGDRTWNAPPGVALLASIGFRPTWLDPERAWRLAAVVTLTMAEACEVAAGLRAGTVQLKWPNDLVAIDGRSGDVRKLSGVLGETDGLGTPDARAIIGIGVNADWKPEDFPPDLAKSMTSLAELAPGQVIDRQVMLHVFLEKLEKAISQLRAGKFPADAWRSRQLTNGVPVRLEWPDGQSETVSAVDVDVRTGALIVGELGGGGRKRSVLVGEIRHLRLGGIV